MMFASSDLPAGSPRHNDSTIYFYNLVGTLVSTDSVLLDLGAGRAAWFQDATSPNRRAAQLMKGRVKEVIAADLDPVVLENKACDRAVLIEGDRIPLDDASVDLIVSDFVLEHVDDASVFFAEISRVLKPRGWFCARTPHRLNYVALGARLITGRAEEWLLPRLQPQRRGMDVFPKRYRMNTMRVLDQVFAGWIDASFIYRAEPSYTFGRPIIYRTLNFFHRILPAPLVGLLMIFKRKPY